MEFDALVQAGLLLAATAVAVFKAFKEELSKKSAGVYTVLAAVAASFLVSAANKL